MFKVIDGGLSESASTSRKKFISAHLTNTRLMGVVGVSVCWELEENVRDTRYFQFFYLDYEEFGYDTYEEVIGDESEETLMEVEKIEDRLMGGLGGELREINEKELRTLLRDYIYLNHKAGKMDPPASRTEHILNGETIETVAENKSLMEKECEEIVNDFQLINYFIMRCVGSDMPAARYLTSDFVDLRDFRNFGASTLILNSSELDSSEMRKRGDKDSFTTGKFYLVKSLVENDYQAYHMESEVEVEDLKVKSYRMLSLDKISDTEVNFMTRRDEYVALLDLDIDPMEFSKDRVGILRKAQETPYPAGRLFLIFNYDNDHVKEQVYRIFDDVFGMAFMTDFGELVLSSFKRENLHDIEQALLETFDQEEEIFMIARYSFSMPIVYEYVKSGFPGDFEDFVEMVSEPNKQ
ncbi:MAG: hypothetical protein IJT40_01620 [Firmicutes bacterium]|nr:hypothetical protein [Bacillota bacterium]